MQDIPSISLTTDRSNLYGSTGIFDNYGLSGIDGERPASVELIDPKGGAEFDIFAGLRIRGAVGRSAPKKSLRLFFNSTYDGNLAFPLFGDEGAELFTKVDLRAEQNNSWSSNVDAPWQNTFIREVFSRDTQRDMGELYTRSRYYHLYINGTYWGLYQSRSAERPISPPATLVEAPKSGMPSNPPAPASLSSRMAHATPIPSSTNMPKPALPAKTSRTTGRFSASTPMVPAIRPTRFCWTRRTSFTTY